MSNRFVILANVITAAAAAITAIGFFYAALATRKQLLIMRSQHVREAADKAFAEFDSDEVRLSRAYLFNTDLPSSVDSLTEEQLRAVEKVGLVLERMGFLVETGLIEPPELVLSRLCGAILRSDAKVGPYLEQERSRRNDSDHFQYYEKLVERAWTYWRSQHGEEEPASFTRQI